MTPARSPALKTRVVMFSFTIPNYYSMKFTPANILLAILLLFTLGSACKKKNDPDPGSPNSTPTTPAAKPEVGFGYKGSELVGDTTWFFTSNAPAGATFAWDFGDGNKSTEAAPVHIYQNSGIYTIKCRINNQYDAVGISKISVVDDPLYTYKIAGNRTWLLRHKNRDSTYTTNTTFSITPVDKIKISMPALDKFFGSIQLKYDQSLSSGNVLVFKQFDCRLYYDHIMDTLYFSDQRETGKAEYAYVTGSSK